MVVNPRPGQFTREPVGEITRESAGIFPERKPTGGKRLSIRRKEPAWAAVEAEANRGGAVCPGPPPPPPTPPAVGQGVC